MYNGYITEYVNQKNWPSYWNKDYYEVLVGSIAAYIWINIKISELMKKYS